MGNKVLESAAEVLEARSDNYTAYYGENLTAKLTWQNHVIDAGTPVQVGFLLGDGQYLYVFELEGMQWLIGSLAETVAPALKDVRTDNIPSKAAWVLNGAFDGLGFVGMAVGQIGVVTWEGRIIGIHADQFLANMQFLGFKWFANVLTVEPPGEPAEIQELAFVGG